MSPLYRLRAIAVLVFCLTASAAGVYLWQFEVGQAELRRTMLQQTEQRAAQLASAMAAQVSQLVRGIDLALRQLRDDYVRNGPIFETTVSSVLGIYGGDALSRVVVIGADGYVAYSSLGDMAPIFLGDRDHFRFHAQSREDRLFLTKPLFSRVVKDWVVLLTRPIYRQGKFAGVVNLPISPGYVSHQLAQVTVSPGDVVGLFFSDGSFLSRSFDWQKVMGTTVPADRPFLAKGAADSGVYRADGAADQIPRIFAWQRLPETGLVVVAGLAEVNMLGPITAETAKGRWRTVGVALLMLVLGGGTALLLLRMARQQQELAANEVRYRRLHESMVDAYARVDLDGHLVEWNRAYEEMLGCDKAELTGKHYADFTPARWHAMEAAIVQQQVLARGHSEVYEKEYIRADGTVFPVELRAFLMRDDHDKPVGMWAIVRDITERKLADAQIHHLAHHDSLTGLPNRMALRQRLEQVMATARREDTGVAVMLVDLDRFKSINDTLGHMVGDQLLIEVAQRLKNAVRENDVVARLGGDEFIVVVTNIIAPEAVSGVAGKIQAAVSQPYAIEGHQLHTTPSVGISLFPADGDNAETLIRHADAAMYEAKSEGRNNWQYYSDSVSEAATERLKVETDLRGALQRGEFLLHFQPQMELASRRIVAVEALVRWQHPEMGLVPPDRFIPVAEDIGLIVPLGEWILDRACEQLRLWRDAGLGAIRMAVNLSALQLQQQSLQDVVTGTLQRHGLTPADLELEVTESMAMRHPAVTVAALGQLKQLGVTVALDDFGTGYSSLSYLKLLPIDSLKLDRSFVGDIETDSSDATICRVTCSLAHELGLTLIAEGVETEAQFAFLKNLGCDLMQGYWLCRPLAAAAAREFIVRHNAAAASAES